MHCFRGPSCRHRLKPRYTYTLQRNPIRKLSEVPLRVQQSIRGLGFRISKCKCHHSKARYLMIGNVKALKKSLAPQNRTCFSTHMARSGCIFWVCRASKRLPHRIFRQRAASHFANLKDSTLRTTSSGHVLALQQRGFQNKNSYQLSEFPLQSSSRL